MSFYRAVLMLAAVSGRALAAISTQTGPTDEIIDVAIEETVAETAERQLVRAVVEYRKLFDPEFTVSSSSMTAGDKITARVLDSLAFNVRTVLRQLSNVHYRTVIDEDTARYASETGGKQRRRMYAIACSASAEPPGTDPDVAFAVYRRSRFECAVCAHVPRILDFLYDLSDDLSEVLSLYRMYYTRCLYWAQRIEAELVYDADAEQYLYDAESVARLLAFVEEFPRQIAPRGYARTAAVFLENAVRHMSGVNKVTVIAENPNLAERKTVKFGGVPAGDFFRSRDAAPAGQRRGPRYAPAADGGGRTKRRATMSLGRLNEKFANVASENVSGLSTADAVNRLVGRAFRTLRSDFESRVRRVEADGESQQPPDAAVESVSERFGDVFAEFCRRGAPIVVYLADECDGGLAAIGEPFGLLLTYCADWVGALDTRCPATAVPRGLAMRDCMAYVVLDRINVNAYWAAGLVETTPADGGRKRVVDAASTYVIGVHNAVVEYYSRASAPVPFWAASDWLTGWCFLAEYHDRPLRITAAGPDRHGGNSRAFEMFARDAYAIVVPWVSNPDYVFEFRGAMTAFVERETDDRVLRHARLVHVYLQLDGFDADVVETRLSDTIRWYTETRSAVRRYLSVPGVRERWNAKADAASSAIAGLNGTAHGASGGLADVLPTVLAETSEWAEAEKLDDASSPAGEFRDRWNRLLLENCQQAGRHVNMVLDAAYRTGARQNDVAIDVDRLYCLSGKQVV